DAELVRGFITTPLERAIAAADGIDYIQSQSQQGVSTITARLKLNYDAHKALSDISSRVDAIRRDLPPESEIPVIAIQPADSQFASAYLSFTSDILQPNEVTDYLVRLVQPRLTSVGGVQKADILGGRIQDGSTILWAKSRLHGHLGPAKCKLDRRHQTRASGTGADQERTPDGHDRGDGLRRHGLHQRCHPRSCKNVDRHSAHRDGRDLFVPRVVPICSCPNCRDSNFPHWRIVFDAAFWVLPESAHPLGNRAVSRVGRR